MPLTTDVRGVVRAARGGRADRVAYQGLRRLHAATGGRSSSVVAGVVRHLPRQGPPPPSAPVDADLLAALRRDGVAVLPWRLDAAVVAGIREHARAAPCAPLGTTAARYRELLDRAGGSFAGTVYDDLRDEVPMVHVSVVAAMADRHVQAVAADPRYTDLAAAYLRAAPVVQPMSLTWTTRVPLPDRSPHATRNATLYHWDYDGIGTLRVHAYLTDVGPDDAPMRYLRGSHRAGRRRTRLLRAGDVGHSDPAAFHACGEDAEVVVTGPAGTVFVSDGFGLHRGSPNRGAGRLLGVLAVGATALVTAYPGKVPVRALDPVFAARQAAGDPALRMFPPAG